jgi:hypothetical protein
VVDVGEYPHPPVEAGPGHGGVGAPPQVGSVGDDGPVMGPLAAPSPHPLRCQQAGSPHQPQHPFPTDPDPVFATETGPDLAVSRVFGNQRGLVMLAI